MALMVLLISRVERVLLLLVVRVKLLVSLV